LFSGSFHYVILLYDCTNPVTGLQQPVEASFRRTPMRLRGASGEVSHGRASLRGFIAHRITNAVHELPLRLTQPESDLNPRTPLGGWFGT